MRRLALHITAAALCLIAVSAQSAWAAAPTILNAGVSKVGTDSATLRAEVNPGGLESFYRFEYGPDDCLVATCTAVPVPEGEIPASSDPGPISVEVKGLAPGTTYHMRLVVSNIDGSKEVPDRVFATYVPAFEGLPDGRAYEQASPVDKNAADARGRVAWAKASSDGNRVSFLSTSGIAGGLGEQELPLYLSSRGSDWSTQGVLPRATLGDEAYVRGWTPDLSQVFDYATNLGGEGDGTFVSRSSADGSLREIVGHGEGLDSNFENLTYAGASADGSKVLFEATGALSCCPEAVAGQSNVYLWDRDSDQISLVSKLNDEQSPPLGAFAGPYDWMLSETLPLTAKSSALYTYYTQDSHAISSDGNAVYFTAKGDGALYERINPSAAQSPLDLDGKCTDPALACTLELSASHRTPPDPLGSRPAAFMAAAEDGSRAFFASPEELTDESNTGPDQLAPSIQSAPVAGTPIADLPSIAAGGIAVDGEYIYYVNSAANTIGRVKLNGEDRKDDFIAVPPLKVGPVGEVEDVPANPQYVAVDAGHIYWTNEGRGENKEGTIGRADIEGTPESIEVEWITGASRPKGIAVNGTYVFWGNAGKDEAGRGLGRAKVADGGEANQNFIPADVSQRIQGVAVDAAHIYWSVADTSDIPPFGLVKRADLNGSNIIVTPVGSNTELRGIAVDSGHVYWASQGDEAIGRADLDLKNVERHFIPVAGKPKGLATDVTATHLYWSLNGESVPNPGNDLYLYEAENEALEDLTFDPADTNGAEVKGILGASKDGKRVYFAANGDLDGPGGPASAGNCQGSASGRITYSGQCSLYLLEEVTPGDWMTSFIARLDAGGGEEQSDALNWVGHGGLASQYERSALLSADGATLLFRSQRKLSDYDNEGVPELYRYEVGDDGPSCVSCNPTGEAPSGAPRLGSINLTAQKPQTDPLFLLSRNLSADGKRAFFESTEALVADDTNGKVKCDEEGSSQGKSFSCLDVYEWEAQGTGSCNEDVQGGGCLYLLSTGVSPNASFFADASLSGNDAFIATRSDLVGQDQDQLQDIYDTRVGGGIPSQNPPPATQCESLDGCHGPQSAPPAAETPASATFTGPANKKHPRAKKHKHKKHHHHKKHKRPAHKTGRTGR
jgi:hypothetical protein